MPNGDKFFEDNKFDLESMVRLLLIGESSIPEIKKADLITGQESCSFTDSAGEKHMGNEYTYILTVEVEAKITKYFSTKFFHSDSDKIFILVEPTIINE